MDKLYFNLIMHKVVFIVVLFITVHILFSLQASCEKKGNCIAVYTTLNASETKLTINSA